MTIGDVVHARGDYNAIRVARGMGNASYSDAQLEKVLQDIGTVVPEGGLEPNLALHLTGVVIPTEEEWSAVSSQHTEGTS